MNSFAGKQVGVISVVDVVCPVSPAGLIGKTSPEKVVEGLLERGLKDTLLEIFNVGMTQFRHLWRSGGVYRNSERALSTVLDDKSHLLESHSIKRVHKCAILRHHSYYDVNGRVLAVLQFVVLIRKMEHATYAVSVGCIVGIALNELH